MKEACPLIEQKLGRPLLYLACRHIMEILLECMFSKCLGPSSGPEIKVFQRFKTERKFINQDEIKAMNLEPEPDITNEIISFCSSQLQEYQPRDDYKEFLQLTMITMGVMPESKSGDKSYHFVAPGATKQDEWERPFIQ